MTLLEAGEYFAYALLACGALVALAIVYTACKSTPGSLEHDEHEDWFR